jgi:hypothetical protein
MFTAYSISLRGRLAVTANGTLGQVEYVAPSEMWKGLTHLQSAWSRLSNRMPLARQVPPEEYVSESWLTIANVTQLTRLLGGILILTT